MGLINGIPLPDPNVRYEGYTLPQDAAVLADPPINPTVRYAGRTLPNDALPPPQPTIDLSNNPSAIVIGSVFLPASTQVILRGEKIIAESQIIDGVSVFEHISRKPYEIDFDITIWQSDNSNQASTTFPQQQINNIFTDLWLPNSVQTLNNTYLNGLGIQQIIIKSIAPKPRLGSTILVITIRAYENQVGQTIIL